MVRSCKAAQRKPILIIIVIIVITVIIIIIIIIMMIMIIIITMMFREGRFLSTHLDLLSAASELFPSAFSQIAR